MRQQAEGELEVNNEYVRADGEARELAEYRMAYISAWSHICFFSSHLFPTFRVKRAKTPSPIFRSLRWLVVSTLMTIFPFRIPV